MRRKVLKVLSLLMLVLGVYTILAATRLHDNQHPSIASSSDDVIAGAAPPHQRHHKRIVCKPINRIAFLKVHKAGSSTVANILQRYGYSRHLNFVVPKKRLHAYRYNYIGKPEESVNRKNVLPHPSGQSYDILWNHVKYNRTAFKSVLPNNTAYITMIREPFDQFISAFQYYGMVAGTPISKMISANVGKAVSDYLQNPIKYEPDSLYVANFIRNKQAVDFGMTANEIQNADLRRDYIVQLSQDFKVVMIMEYFDESLVLLKRHLCWSFKDIIYITKNKNPFKIKGLYSKEDHERHKALSPADYDLYSFFHKRFWAQIWKEGSDFFQEVRFFKSLLIKALDYCLMRKILYVPRTRWSHGFVIGPEDCEMMQLHELKFHDKIYNYTLAKLSQHL